MKLFIPLIIATGVGFTAFVYASPSDNGLEHGQRLGWNKQDKTQVVEALPSGQESQPFHVPDGGSTLGLLALGCIGLAFYRFKLA